MTKKFFSVFITAFIFVLSFCSVTVFAEEDNINVGDEIRFIFTIGNIQNITGVSVETIYNIEYITAENIVCNVSGSESNISTPGEVKWNFLVYNGIDFNNDDVAVVTFKALKKCNINNLAIKYNCRECFNPDIQPVADDPNSIFTVRAVHNGEEYKVYPEGSANLVEVETDIIDNNINEITNTENNNINLEETIGTDNSEKSYTTTLTTQKLSDNNIPIQNSTVTQTSYSSNTANVSVNTSGEQNFTVISLLMILVFSVTVVIGLNKSDIN